MPDTDGQRDSPASMDVTGSGLIVVGATWFFVGLLPMLGVVQVGSQAHADRYTYWAGCGLSAIVMAAAQYAWKTSLARHALKATVAVLTLALITVALSVTTWRQVGHWQDTIGLFRHTYAVTKGNGWAACAMGDAYARAGRFEEAERYYRESIAIRPNEENLAGLAILLTTTARDGNCDEAYELANRALAHSPDDPSANEAMGLIALRVGAWQPAEEHLVKSTRRHARNPITLEWLAMAQFNQKKYLHACETYKRALALRPDDDRLRGKYEQAVRFTNTMHITSAPERTIR